jgi:hypothetical protein
MFFMGNYKHDYGAKLLRLCLVEIKQKAEHYIEKIIHSSC